VHGKLAQVHRYSELYHCTTVYRFAKAVTQNFSAL